MSYHIIFKTLLIMGMLLITAYLLVPKCMHYWIQWKKIGKHALLSNAIVICYITVLLFLGTLFVFFSLIRELSCILS